MSTSWRTAAHRGKAHFKLPKIELLTKPFHILLPRNRSETDRMITLQRLRDMGAFLTTTETVILGFAADAKHPKFKGLQKLCMEAGPDTGLLK